MDLSTTRKLPPEAAGERFNQLVWFVARTVSMKRVKDNCQKGILEFTSQVTFDH